MQAQIVDSRNNFDGGSETETAGGLSPCCIMSVSLRLFKAPTTVFE